MSLKWLDSRKYSIRTDSNGVTTLCFNKLRRKEKKLFDQYGENYIETAFLYPTNCNLHPNKKCLDIPIKYDYDETLYLIDVLELGKYYPKTLSIFLGVCKDVDKDVEEYLNNIRVPLHHHLPIGTICYIKNEVNASTAFKDRIVIITEHINVGLMVYPFLLCSIPLYNVKHIEYDGTDINKWTESEDNWTERISINGTELKNGGEGEVSLNDIECIVKHKEQIYIQKLFVKIYEQEQTIKKYKNHSKLTAESIKDRLGFRLQNWLKPGFRDRKLSWEVFCPQNIKSKEFTFILRVKGISDDEWIKTKYTETLDIEYNKSISLFGKKSIVRKYRRMHGTVFILSHIRMLLSYNIKREMLKITVYCETL